MQELKLTTGEVVLVDANILKDVSKYDWRIAFDGNVCAYIGRYDFMLCRLVMDATTGDGQIIKYKNGNPLDCRKENLFIVDKSKKILIKKA